MDWVLDASAALSWSLPHQGGQQAEHLLKAAGQAKQLWVPAIWWYEVTNAILVMERTGNLSVGDAERLQERLNAMPLRTDASPDPLAASRILSWGRAFGLSAYDAAYIELAERHGLGLLTLDKALHAAAVKAKVRTP